MNTISDDPHDIRAGLLIHRRELCQRDLTPDEHFFHWSCREAAEHGLDLEFADWNAGEYSDTVALWESPRA